MTGLSIISAVSQTYSGLFMTWPRTFQRKAPNEPSQDNWEVKMLYYAPSETFNKADPPRSAFGRLFSMTDAVIAAFCRDVMIGFAAHGNAMSGGPPMDFAVEAWCESDLDVLLSVKLFPAPPELESARPDPDMLSATLGDGHGADSTPSFDSDYPHPGFGGLSRGKVQHGRRYGRSPARPLLNGHPS